MCQGETGQYKLCVCMPSGRLFKVAVPDDNYQRPPSSQVSCDWWRAGHVTQCSPLIGCQVYPHVLASWPTWLYSLLVITVAMFPDVVIRVLR